MSEIAKKILLSLLVFLVTLGILFGVYFLYKQFFVNQPLSLTLENSELIAQYEIIQDKENPALKLTLNQTDNLGKSFMDFLEEGGQLLTKKDLSVKISSSPNQKMLDFYQEIHPAVYEVLLQGNYTQLQDKIKKINEQFHLTEAKLYVTESYIFLQLEDGSSYLYCIFTTDKESTPRFINEIGSEKS